MMPSPASPLVPVHRKALRSDAGLTLVELLVVVALLGLIGLALSGNIRFGAQVWARTNEISQDLSKVYFAQEFLRQRLETMILGRVGSVDKNGTGFMASADALTFQAELPDDPGFGGRYQFELQLDDGELVLFWRLADQYFEQPPTPARLVLLSHIRKLMISYYVNRQDISGDFSTRQGEWVSDWRKELGQPRLIRIDVEFDDEDRQEWPTMIVSPKLSRTG